MERERERSLEAGVGAREGALVAVGGEPVNGVRADLGLDPRLPQRVERAVARAELDDVRLPAVPVALLRRGSLHDPGQALAVRLRHPVARLPQLLEPAQLDE